MDGGANEPREALPTAEFRQELTAAIPYMRAFSRSLTGNEAAADDLTQDALVKAWRARERFRAGTNFRAWIFTIVRNQFYSDQRRSWRQAPWDEEKAKRTLSGPQGLDSMMALDELRRALVELPDDQREAIVLVGAGGFAYEEAAQICGCAVGTIKSRVSRARKALAAMLEDGAEPLPDNVKGQTASNAADLLMAEVDSLANAGRKG
ncbi:MAG: sigma-70 family RNA polymerase sigma factor [Oceanicaulis sp.]